MAPVQERVLYLSYLLVGQLWIGTKQIQPTTFREHQELLEC